MSNKAKDPYSKLVEMATQRVQEEKEEALYVAETYCETPIESLFLTALWMACKFGGTEIDGIMYVEDEETLERLQSSRHYDTSLVVQCQQQVGDWRVDFIINYFDVGYPNRPQKWTKLIVECDGHDFHERTKAQAARDRKHDRLSQHSGLPVLRFTGSELWADPWSCAMEVIAWAQKTY